MSSTVTKASSGTPAPKRRKKDDTPAVEEAPARKEEEQRAAEAENVAEAERLAAEADPELEEAAPSFPRAWMWDDDGNLAVGTFVKVDRAPTRGFGPRTVVVLDIDGEERSLWLLNEALFNQFRTEVQSRPDRKLTPGERVVAQRLGKRTSESTGRTYVDFRVAFPDRPPPTIEALWGTDVADDKPVEQPAADDAKPDGDIPF
jgi:hypothetical protein